MKRSIDPSEVFSGYEVVTLKMLIRFFNNPLIPAAAVVEVVYVGSIILIIAIVQFGFNPPIPRPVPMTGLFIISVAFGIFAFFVIRPVAKWIFAIYDRAYFTRSGVAEDEYVEELKDMAYREAAIYFTEMPDGFNLTVYDFPDHEQAAALREYQANFVRRCADEEERLIFKGYVARRYGLRIPLRR